MAKMRWKKFTKEKKFGVRVTWMDCSEKMKHAFQKSMIKIQPENYLSGKQLHREKMVKLSVRTNVILKTMSIMGHLVRWLLKVPAVTTMMTKVNTSLAMFSCVLVRFMNACLILWLCALLCSWLLKVVSTFCTYYAYVYQSCIVKNNVAQLTIFNVDILLGHINVAWMITGSL